MIKKNIYIKNKVLHKTGRCIIVGTLIFVMSMVSYSYIPEEVTYAADNSEVEDTSDDNDIFYIYSWNEQLDEIMPYFYDKYPEYRDKVICKVVPSGDTKDYIDTVRLDIERDNGESPSLVLYDGDYKDEMLNMDIFLPVEEVGITEDMCGDMYPFTLNTRYNDELMGLTWRASPVGFCYNLEVAEEVFGSSDSEVVGEYFSTWDNVLESAKLLKDAGYYLLPETESVKTIMSDNYNQSVIDSLVDNEYSKEVEMWSYEWIDGYNDDVFGYLLPPWYSFSLFGISYIDNTTIPTGVCAFPDSYFWGETYISATKNCKDLEIARLFLETLCCDADTMYEIGINNEWDLMNNRSAVQKMIDNQDKPWSDGALETDDVLVVYDSIAGNIMNTGSLNNVSSVDEDDAEETDTSDSAGSSDEAVTNDTDIYSVVEGDCLWKIAEEYYGDGAEYVKIYEANRSVIDAHGGGADLIYVGDVLILP